jgi:hypothetical protein
VDIINCIEMTKKKSIEMTKKKSMEMTKKKSNAGKIQPKPKSRYENVAENTSEHISATPESKSKFLRIIL